MYRRFLALVGAAPLVGMSAAAAAAQDPTPMPAAEYREALVAYGVAKEAADAESDLKVLDGPLTMAEMLEDWDANLELSVAEIERLRSVTPEDCYAEAHEVYLGYFDHGLRAEDSLRSQAEEATDILDLLPQVFATVAEVEARFPAFFESPDPDATPVPGVDIQPRAQFFHLRAFDTLNTCEGMPEWEVPAEVDD